VEDGRGHQGAVEEGCVRHAGVDMMLALRGRGFGILVSVKGRQVHSTADVMIVVGLLSGVT
jgi:hypothetical protein